MDQAVSSFHRDDVIVDVLQQESLKLITVI